MKSARNVKIVGSVAAAIVVGLVVFCGFQLSNLNTTYSVRQFFPKDHPSLNQDRRIERLFNLRTQSAYLVTVSLPAAKTGTFLEPGHMKWLAGLTEKIAAFPETKSALSLATVPLAVFEGDELRVGTLGETLPPRRWAAHVANQALLQPQLISKDQRSVIVVVEPKSASTAVLGRLEENLSKALAKTGAGFETGVAGVPAVQSRLSERLLTEVGRFLILSLLTFGLMFLLFYRNVGPMIVAFAGLIFCNITVLGALALTGLPFTVLLSTLPIIVSIAFVSIAIHTFHLWADRLVEAGSPTDLVMRWRLAVRVLREILMANFLGSLTTAIGFAVLVSASIPAIQQYAMVISASVMTTFVLTQSTFVFVLPWLTPVQRTWTRRRAWWMLPILRRSGPIFVMVIGASVFMGGAVGNLNFSSRLFDDLPKDEPVLAAMGLLDREFGGTINLDVTIDAGRANSWTDPAGLRQLRAALTEIRSLENVGAAVGFPDFLGDRTPKSRGAVSEMMFLYSMGTENPLRGFVDNSLRRTRISIRMPDLPSSKVDRLRADVREILHRKLPKASLIETGLAVNSHTINREVAKSLVYGFWHSLLAIGVLLLIVFRSLRWALLACVPNLVPPAVLIGTMAFLQTPVKPAIALIFSIALGLAFNNTVYLLTRLRSLRESKGLGMLPLRRTLLEEGNPCLSESLLTFAGFLIFLSSGFSLNQTFGAYMVLSILAGAVGDLVFLPAMIKLFPEILGRGPERRPRSSAAAWTPADEASAPAEKTSIPPAAAAAIAGLLLTGVIFSAGPAAADEASDLLAKARGQVEARSDQATVVLKIIEANGDVKSRRLQLKTLREDGSFRAIARILSPADIKGTALLAEVKDGSESQWLYLPSSRQVRRIVSGKKSSGVLGSELSSEDLNAAAVAGAGVKLLKKDGKRAWLEVKPKAGTSEYSRVVVILALPAALPLKTEYYIGGKVRKTVEFKEYVSLGGGVKRARRIIVKNLANRRGTEVEFSNMKVNGKLSADDFSVGALKRGR